MALHGIELDIVLICKDKGMTFAAMPGGVGENWVTPLPTFQQEGL